MVQISRVQLITMLIWTILGTGIIAVPGMIAQFTVHDAWLAMLLISLGGLLSALVAWAFVRSFPGVSLTDALRLALGPWIGTLLAVWYSGWLLVAMAAIAREFSAFVTTTVLPKTPEYFADFLMFCVVAFLVYQGIEVVARVNEFMTPIALVVTPLLFVLAMRAFDAGQFFPVLADGFAPVWHAGVVGVFGYGLQMMLALQFVPLLRSPRTLPWDILVASAIVTLVMTISVVITVGVLGPAVTYLMYPILEVVRSIRLGQFIERLDTLYVMGVVVTIVLKLSVFHASLCYSLKDICRTQGTRWATWITALTAWSASYMFYRNIADVMHVVMEVAPSYTLCTLLGLPMLAVAAQFVGSRLRQAGRRS